MPPQAPIRLIMAFPFERRGLGVRSGMSATAGLRYVPIATSTTKSTPTKTYIFQGCSCSAAELSIIGRNTIVPTATTVPKTKNGIRLPHGCVHLSERAPKNGSKKRASTLSRAIRAPEMVSSRCRVLVSINGITLLYICQNAQIEKNAKPMRTVRFTLSFISLLKRSKNIPDFFIVSILNCKNFGFSACG